jgi:hypothetical protein
VEVVSHGAPFVEKAGEAGLHDASRVQIGGGVLDPIAGDACNGDLVGWTAASVKHNGGIVDNIAATLVDPSIEILVNGGELLQDAARLLKRWHD